MLKAIKSFIVDFLSRHKDNLNRLSHIIGVPLAFLGIFQLFTERWGVGFTNLFIGYLCQWIGHTHFERNQVGEWILIKKIMKRLVKK